MPESTPIDATSSARAARVRTLLRRAGHRGRAEDAPDGGRIAVAADALPEADVLARCGRAAHPWTLALELPAGAFGAGRDGGRIGTRRGRWT